MAVEAGTMKANREHFWEERSTEAKVEVLRAELVRACRLIERQGAQINALLEHQHSSMNGQLLTPLYRAGMNLAIESSSGSFTNDRDIPFSLRTERERH